MNCYNTLLIQTKKYISFVFKDSKKKLIKFFKTNETTLFLNFCSRIENHTNIFSQKLEEEQEQIE